MSGHDAVRKCGGTWLFARSLPSVGDAAARGPVRSCPGCWRTPPSQRSPCTLGLVWLEHQEAESRLHVPGVCRGHPSGACRWGAAAPSCVRLAYQSGWTVTSGGRQEGFPQQLPLGVWEPVAPPARWDGTVGAGGISHPTSPDGTPAPAFLSLAPPSHLRHPKVTPAKERPLPSCLTQSSDKLSALPLECTPDLLPPPSTILSL